MTGCLVLEDGTVFRGESVAADGRAFGEAVFTTSMSGYQETVTDPSYAGQIVCFTAPMVGNYGVADERSQSGAVHATAVVMREVGGPEWTDWLRSRGVVAVAGLDTRSLVLHLRDRGAMRAAAVAGDPPVDEVLAEVRALPSMEGAALRGRRLAARAVHVRAARGTSGSRSSTTGSSARSCASWRQAGAAVDVYPARRGRRHARRLRRRRCSERPGRPGAARRRGAHRAGSARSRPGARRLPRPPAARARDRTRHLQASVRPPRREPSGASTTRRGRVLVTSPEPRLRGRAGRRGRRVTHTSRCTTAPSRASHYPELRARSVQFHPEASPGPHDGAPIIAEWVEELRAVA